MQRVLQFVLASSSFESRAVWRKEGLVESPLGRKCVLLCEGSPFCSCVLEKSSSLGDLLDRVGWGASIAKCTGFDRGVIVCNCFPPMIP